MKWFGSKSAGREGVRPLLARFVGGVPAGAVAGASAYAPAHPAPSYASPAYAGPVWTSPHGYGARGDDAGGGYEAQVRAAYRDNPVAQRAVRLIAEGVGGAPLLASDSRALALVCATSAGQGLLETIAAQLLLHGNSYVLILARSDGHPAELFALRPERVTIEPDARGWPLGYAYRLGSHVTRIEPQRIIHIRTMNPLDDLYGLGSLGAAAAAVATHNAAARWNRALLDNSARPSGALVYAPGSVGTTLSPAQFERLRAEIDSGYSGLVNAGRPMLLEGGLTWQSLSFSPTDMDFATLKAAAARDIALAFGVPPVLLGLPGDATYANFREANRALWRQTLLPLAGKILGALAQGLDAAFPALSLAVDLDRISELGEDRERLWSTVSQADFLSSAEKRALLGLPETMPPP